MWRLIALIIGNVFEWYDFMLFGALSSIIGVHFFSNTDIPRFATFIAAWGVFATGFFMRPFGGFVIGFLGDKYGRRYALLLSICAMALPSFLTGCIPSYSTIGWWAPVILILLRLLQGLSVGGELPGTMVALVEGAPERSRCLNSVYAIMGIGAGLLTVTIVLTVLHLFFTEQQVVDWAWRIPFVGGVLLSGFGIIVRLLWKKPPFHSAINFSQTLEGLFGSRKRLFKIVGIQLFPALSFNLVLIYTHPYLTNVLHHATLSREVIEFLLMGTFLIGLPIFGWVADRVGIKKVMIIGAVVAIVWSIPFYWLLRFDTFYLLIAIVPMVLAMCCYYGGVTVMMIDLIRQHIRYSSVALMHGLTFAIFAGTAPIVAAILIEHTGYTWAPGIYLGIGAIISLITTFSIREQ